MNSTILMIVAVVAVVLLMAVALGAMLAQMGTKRSTGKMSPGRGNRSRRKGRRKH